MNVTETATKIVELLEQQSGLEKRVTEAMRQTVTTALGQFRDTYESRIEALESRLRTLEAQGERQTQWNGAAQEALGTTTLLTDLGNRLDTLLGRTAPEQAESGEIVRLSPGSTTASAPAEPASEEDEIEVRRAAA